MSGMNNFDDFLKDSFSDYSPDVPPHIWENIAAGKKKKKPAGFWWNERKALLIAAALLLVGGASYFLFNQKNGTHDIAHENNSSRQGTGNTVPAAVLQDENIASNTNQQPIENKEETINATNTTAPVENITSPVDKADKLDGVGKNYNVTPPGSKNADVSVDTKQTQPVAVKGKRTGKLTANSYSPGAVTNDDVADDSNDGIATKKDEFAISLLTVNRDLMLLAKQAIPTKQIIQPITNSNIKISEDCPGIGAGNTSYFEAYISPDYAIKKYSDTGNSTLVSKRKESLRYHFSYSAGLRYTKVFANGMSIRAGVNYSQVNEKFSYLQDNVVQQVFVINPQGDTTDSYYVRGTRYRNSYNHYRTIDVPVTIGYEMGNGNFHANINAGAVINLYSWQAGETIDNNGAPVNITTGKSDNPYQYKTNVGIGFTAAASLYYKINGRFHVLAEPYLRYNFSPMNKEALSIQEKFTTIGLRLGIRMDLK